jgi:hypothetical protein
MCVIVLLRYGSYLITLGVLMLQGHIGGWARQHPELAAANKSNSGHSENQKRPL